MIRSFKYFVLIFVLTALNFQVFAQSFLATQIAAEPDPSCAVTADPYDQPHRISTHSQKFSGQCVDTQRFRFAEVLESNDQVLRFANYKHKGQYWLAELSPKAKVKQVFFHVVKFQAISGVTAAHTQMRLTFAKESPLRLTSQTDAELSEEVFDLVISFEASRPEAVPYNFALGSVNNYVSVARILSGEQRQAESTENITEQYELNLPEEEKILLALRGVEKSHQEGFKRFYNTISENCTTDIFNLIDALPSRVGQNPPFLTVLSNDPIAGPSIKALKERGIYKARFVDLDEELYKGLSGYKPEPVTTKEAGLLPEVPDHPYSLVFAAPDNKNLSAEQQKAVSEIKALAYDVVPRALHLAGSSLMLAEGDSQKFLMNFLNEASVSLKKRLKAMNDQLPEKDPVSVVTYFVPWSSTQGEEINLNDVTQAKARLPFSFYQIKHGDLGHISAGVNRAIATQDIPEFGVQAYGLALQFYLQKDHWQVSLQLLTGLKDRLDSLAVKNTQVKISEFSVPQARLASEQPVALFNLTLTPEDLPPNLDIEFGSFGGLKGRKWVKDFAQFNIFDSGGCGLRLAATPQLSGHFAEQATGNSIIDFIFHGKEVSFNIFKVDMDLKTQRVIDMDVRFNFYLLGLPVRCLSREDVNKSFKQNANAQLGELIKSLQNSDTEDLVEPVIKKLLTGNSSAESTTP